MTTGANSAGIRVHAFDHIVLAAADVPAARILRERSGHGIARGKVPGSGNFCLLTETPIERVVEQLTRESLTVVAGPGERAGATAPILSVYFRNPDGNPVEVGNRLQPGAGSPAETSACRTGCGGSGRGFPA